MRCRTRFVPQAKRLVAAVLVAAVTLASFSCGTLIHRDRWGQKPTGRLDSAVVGLDGIALLVFFIPGAVGFVVDFATGAIWLPERYEPYRPAFGAPPIEYPLPPPAGYPVLPPAGGDPVPPPAGGNPVPPPTPAGDRLPPQVGDPSPTGSSQMTRIAVDPATLDKEKIEAIVRERTGKEIDLDAANVSVKRVETIDQAADALSQPAPLAPR